MGVAQLGSFDRADQRAEVLKRAQAEIAKVVNKDDASKAVRCFPCNKLLMFVNRKGMIYLTPTSHMFIFVQACVQ